jgi:transposase-like protein
MKSEKLLERESSLAGNSQTAIGSMPSVDLLQSAEDQIPNPEVKTRRRKLTREYKLRILKEAEKLKGKSGAIGELLRREGIYSAALVTWRKQRDEGILAPTRGRKSADPLVHEMLVLKKQNDRLIEKNRQYRLVIEAQKKMSEILGIRQDNVPPMPEEDGEE